MLQSTAFRLAPVLALLVAGTVCAQQNPNGQLPITTSPQSYLFLIRDPLVLDDLRVSAQQREILAKLSERQKKQWVDLLGRRIDLAALGRVTFEAPDLTEEPDWINSSPLTSDQLRGKVVALHFYAFGCINCKRNFPWYKEWHEAFHNRGLVVLGIQTPETERERVAENVRKAAQENELKFPIVHDAEKHNWNAWGNSMWPSTYLIDKKGRVRYWWYGELDWKGAGGQNLMRARIEELLAE